MPAAVLDDDTAGPAPTSGAPAGPHPSRFRRALPLLLATVPALVMVALVRSGSRLQYNDYWLLIERTVSPSGWLDLGSLFTFQNEHPIVVPKLVYWANVAVTGGSNTALGLFVVLVVAAQVVLVWKLVPAERRTTAAGTGLVALAGVLLFARSGVHNFMLAMSGTAWLTANLFVVAALVARTRDRVWLAVGLGVLASLSYGTGLAVWPALVVCGMLHERRWRPDLVVLGYGALVGLGYVVLRNPSEGGLDPALDEVVRAAGAVAGAVVSDGRGVAELASLLGLVTAVAAVVVLLRRGDAPVAAPWAGLLTYAVAAAVVIGRSRAGFLDNLGSPSRYVSIGALFWLAVAALVVSVLRYRAVLVLPMAALALAVAVLGGEEVDRQRAALPGQAELTAALALDLADGNTYLPFIGYPRVAPLLEQIGHYPFDGSYDGACGLLGQRLPRSAPTTGPEDGQIADGELMDHTRGIRFVGWVPEDRVDDVACVLITDWSRAVVGFGAMGSAGDDVDEVVAERTFGAVAPVGSVRYGAYLVMEDATLLRLHGEVTTQSVLARGG